MIYKFLLILLWAPAVSLAADLSDPWLVIERAGQAAHQLSYKGVFVYQSGNTVSSMQIMHSNFGPKGEFARVVVLDGSPREMLRQGNDVVLYQPKSEKVMIDKRRLQQGFPAVVPRISDDLKSNYQIRSGASERIGGREGQAVFLEPRDGYRYRCRMWTDRDSGLLLKMALLNDKDEVVEQVAFNQLGLMGDAGMEWFRPEVQRGKNYEIAPEEKVSPGKSGWQVTQLPQGFRKLDQVVREVPGKPAPVQQLVFSDGLALVSLFIEPLAPRDTPMIGSFSQGATNGYMSVNNGHQVVAVGEVPAVTVAQMVNSVIFQK